MVKLLREKRDRAVSIVHDVNRVGPRIQCCHQWEATHSFVRDLDVAIIDVPSSAGVSIQFCPVEVAGDRDVNARPLLIDRYAASENVRSVISRAGWERTHHN